MSEKIKVILLILIMGWFLGYVQRHVTTVSALQEADRQTTLLERELKELTKKSYITPRVTVKATAYSNDIFSINVPQWRDGMTATNKVARRGYVAADWTLFPPGTRLYIPGYGEAIVEDRGGAVKGYHLDLFVDTRKEAIEWGVRQMEVYVLEKASKKSES